jgi:hypothetical protein
MNSLGRTKSGGEATPSLLGAARGVQVTFGGEGTHPDLVRHNAATTRHSMKPPINA